MPILGPMRSDPLAEALLPVLVHKLGNATQLLTGLNAMLQLDGGEELFQSRSNDLSRCSITLNDLGWAMAVVGSGAGGDLLMARRDPNGLSTLVGLVGEALRREDRTQLTVPSDLPRLANEVLSGWELPWAIASALLIAGRESGDRVEWSLIQAGDAWDFHVSGGQALSEWLPSILGRIPGAEGAISAGHAQIRLPGPWLLSAAD